MSFIAQVVARQNELRVPRFSQLMLVTKDAECVLLHTEACAGVRPSKTVEVEGF